MPCLALGFAGAEAGASVPQNGAFADRVTLSQPGFFTAGNTSVGFAEPGEPAHAGLPAQRSIWWECIDNDYGFIEINTLKSSI
ncbi:MAG: hypothetical protein EA425_00760, partial [Puniceicoccaceae bacterium]